MVPDEYAARTVCSPHSRRCTKSFLGRFYSDCEGRPVHDYVCKYSHTILNTKRILRLGINDKSPNFSIRLEYGYGFERYGMYDGWTDGWDVFVNDLNLGSAGYDEKTYNLPKSVLLAEHKLGMKTFNPSADKADGKVQSICRNTHDRGFCRFKNACRYDHDLIDSRRLERLVRWADEGMSPHRDYMTVECRVEGGAPTWRITLKPDAFAKLGLGSNRIQEAYEGGDLLGVVRRMEQVVGLNLKRQLVVQQDTVSVLL
ncbi:hypothetical protein FPV67DRAFT_1477363 [Lyophyllum atratum]|nr:hypothetical protein FPV67DRAFT_1477363 [Lyophyllum atratum]